MADTQEFSNENIQLKLTHEPHCTVSMEVTVSAKATKAAYEKAVHSVTKDISLPGFRKGKAPKKLIEDRYKYNINEAYKETLVNTSVQEALGLSKIYPYNNSSIRELNIKGETPGTPATIKFKFEVYPTVPSITPSDLTLKKVVAPTVNEESIQEVIDRIRRHHAEVLEVTDRPVEEGDEVEVHIEIKNSTLTSPQKQAVRYDLHAGKVDEDLKAILIGSQLEQTIDGTSVLKQDENAPEKSTCSITIHKIRKPNLPELNEELAKKAGAENVDDLRAKIIKSLEKQVEDTVADLKREQVQLALLEKYPFDLPSSIVKKEQERRLHIRNENLQRAHLKEEQIDKLKNQIESETRREAEQYIRLQYLIFKFVDEQKINVSQEELVQEMVKEMMHDKSTMQLKGDQLRERALSLMTAKKALDTMISQAQTAE